MREYMIMIFVYSMVMCDAAEKICKFSQKYKINVKKTII